MSIRKLLETKMVLTHDELVEALASQEPGRVRTKESLVGYYQRTGRLLRVRRGLYAVVPPGISPKDAPVDPYLLAANASKDAILAYHTALEIHGKAHSVFSKVHYLSHEQHRPWMFRDYSFQRVSFPKALTQKKKEGFGVGDVDRSGQRVRVTKLERCLVDVLDRPEFSGGYEEIWRSLESVEYFDLEVVVEYTLLLGSLTTTAKVGFFLEQHREQLMVEEKHLAPLREQCPKQPYYLDRGASGSQWVSAWSLMVPRNIMERSWQEIR